MVEAERDDFKDNLALDCSASEGIEEKLQELFAETFILLTPTLSQYHQQI